MGTSKQNRNTWLFVGFLLLAGIANLCSRSNISAWDSLMCAINYVTFVGLLLFWIQSVRTRLLPSEAKTCIYSAALLLLLYMLLRIFKYRFTQDIVVIRYSVYAYWVPQLLTSTLFLITGVCIRRETHRAERRQYEKLLLIPAFILSIMVLTNDLHFFVYVPIIDLSQFALVTGTYTYGPGFFLIYIWVILTVVAGLILLFLETGRLLKKAFRDLLCIAVAGLSLILLNILLLDKYDTIRMLNIPEINIFGILGFFEICIRYRLIPCNDNYSGFFHALQMPALITDRNFKPVYRSGADWPAQKNDLKAALGGSAVLDRDLTLFGKEISSGYAFWAEDESRIHLIQEKLQEANEILEQENDLIRAETEQKEKAAYLQSRHRIYHEIAQELYPCQKQIGQLLEQAVPGAEDFREKIAAVSVLNAYVKRKTNLLLLAAEKEKLGLGELFLALQESASYLTLAGLHTTAYTPEDKLLPADLILDLYDAFEEIAQQLTGRVPSLMISWNTDTLRLAAETDVLPDTRKIALPVSFLRSEDIFYMDIHAKKGGEAS